MRMLRNENEIFSEGTIETNQTNVGGAAKIVFAILSGMVTDSIEYSIREPGTNAWEANLKKPFEITIPTRFDNTIRWRDFGKGLSHHFMMTRYAKIGESTKDQDDDAVGGWGFGSKSPLAYLMHQDGAGAFNVISRHQGMRRAYVIGINAGGKIQISCLAEEVMDASDRGTGLEVSFPVQEKDIDRFVQYVDRIYWGFNPAPIVLPANPDRPPIGRGTIISKGSNWALYTSSDYRGQVLAPWSGPHIRVGCVLYPVQLRLLDGLSGFLTQSDNLLMEAPIGSVDVSTSREQLSYTDRTKAALSALFQQYENGLITNIQAQADACTSYFDACKVARAGCEVLGWQRASGLFDRISWRGVPCQQSMFNNISSGATIRVCPIGGRFGHVERFKATHIDPAALAGAKIAVEHSAYRSTDRLAHADLLRQKVLWVRCARNHLPELYTSLGITADDVVILDNIKLPKKVIDPNDVNKPKTKIRVRRQVTWGGNKHTGAIDMLAGGIYIAEDTHASRGRYSTPYYYPSGVEDDDEHFKAISKTSLSSGLMEPFNKLGLLSEEDRERPILIRKTDEVLEGDWISLGEFLKSKIDDNLDMTQVTPRLSWSKDSFDSQLYKLAKYFKHDNFPAVPLDICRRARALIKRITKISGQSETDAFNQHDKMLDFLKLLVPNVSIPKTGDPSSIINTEWEAYLAAHPVLKYVVSEMYISEYGENTEVGSKFQSIVDDYFALSTAAGR